MATELFTNNTTTTVSSGGTTAPAGGTVESWTVASSASFPAASSGSGTQFHIADPALPAEKILVTNVSGTTWTVTRGAESTTPAAHAAGFTVVQVVTAAALAGLAQLAGAVMAGYLAPAAVTLTDAASITLDASKGNSFAVTLTASGHTLANPTNPVDGQAIRVRVIQDATGSRTLTYGTAYNFGAAGAPTLSTGANKVDILGFEYVASLAKWCYLGSGLGF